MTWHPHLTLEVAAEFQQLQPSPWRALESMPVPEARFHESADRHDPARRDLKPLPEPPRVYRYSTTPLEGRCRGVTEQGFQCVKPRVDCRVDHGGRSVDEVFEEYKKSLAQMVERRDADSIEVECVRLRVEMAKHDAAYGLLRESGGAPDDVLLAESQRSRTMLRLSENAIARLRKPLSFGVSPSEWPMEGEDDAG